MSRDFSSGHSTTIEPMARTGNLRHRVPTPPPPPQIVGIIPQYGTHFTSQRVWIKVQNLPRDNDQKYLIGFGYAGTVTTSFVTSEEDQDQILECGTPVTATSCICLLSLMRDDDPQTSIDSSHIYYTFAPRH